MMVSHILYLILLVFNMLLQAGGYVSPPNGGVVAASSPLPAATSGPGPVFNVKNYGAKGDTQSSQQGAFTSGSNIVTCANCNFSNGKTTVGMSVWGNRSNQNSLFTLLSQATITSIDSNTQIHVSINAAQSETGFIVWGDIDDTKVAPAVTATNAASKYLTNQQGYLGQTAASPTLYFPAGAYLFCGLASPMIDVGPNTNGLQIMGDGNDQTILYMGGTGCTTPNNGNVGALINVEGGAQNINVHSLTVNGALGNGLQSASAIAFSGGVHAWDLTVDSWGPGAGMFLGGGILGENLHVTGSAADGIICSACGGELYGSGASNSANSNGNGNLRIVNSNGGSGGEGFRFVGGFVDECGANATGCTQVTNSTDVWFIGASLAGTSSGAALNIDGRSFVHWAGGTSTVFGTDSNASGVVIQSGGAFQSSDVRYISTGTGKCINNSGVFNDNGGNTCESQFPISSGTSTGTTAVLTLQQVTSAVNANCSVGDALFVEGAGISGYNGYYPAGATSGVTAVTATTLTYTTAGSNLGALGAGGTAYCRNLQSYTGTLPKALLNTPVPNTCYITGTFGATTTSAPMCNFRVQSATNITRVLAASTTVTACTVAPVVTITDGTGTITLTLTTAKSQWDSSVDSSSGVGTTIFKPNGTMTVSNTAGTCTTSPTNFSVSYNIAPILSN